MKHFGSVDNEHFGERTMRLTQMTKKGGCAAKVPAVVLREILGGVTFPTKIPEVLVDGEFFDDAAIIRVNDQTALVQTLDFFTPIVDSPVLFGQIAAANALSDVYAMGGIPKTAMAILAFPMGTLPADDVRAILQGASERIAAANASLVGGHSIDDETLKFGLSVTGFVSTDYYWTNAGARAGDLVFLTKPLGTGTLCAGLKRGERAESQIEDALTSMTRLNDIPAHLPEALRRGVTAATDVTGFGLAGHAMQLANASRVTLELEWEKIPRFALAMDGLEREHLTRAHGSNREYTAEAVSFVNLDLLQQLLCVDPQTSGGLLLCVDPAKAPAVQAVLEQCAPDTRQIGVVTSESGKRVIIR